MKYIVMLGDGMADYPIASLSDKTPLDVANKPNMDFLAKNGAVGMVKTVPDGMAPGSDVANLSVMGYDPEIYYTGRSPLEAVSIGIDLGEGDVTYRCNLVTLSEAENYEDADMIDYSAGEISTPEATEIVNYLNEHFKSDKINLYPGVSYRHCLVIKDSKTGGKFTPPHDISKKPIKGHLPEGNNADILYDMMVKSRELLRDHPVNKKRIAEGKNPVTSCWFWGEGTKPAVTSFYDKFGIKGGVISAVDLIKGIGICAGHKSVDVPDTNGNWNTNFKGKAEAALDLLTECDYVYIHVEGPDECGHHGDIEHKISSIESIDKEILGRIIPEMDKRGEAYTILLMPDHPTPISIMTHVSDPVPFVLYRSDKKLSPSADKYSETDAKATGLYVEKACTLVNNMIDGKI
ncbi:MAG: cofactor-independent phosphoglycerate mutase [Clostridia bacterium]|nr:cofactor-independent phosphoglycerate mutase [Clostridia bacterium]